MNMTVNNFLNMFDYVLVTESIADGYFNENGDYTPHYGMLNTMRVFYNYCVELDQTETEHKNDIISAVEFNDIVKDADFQKAFYTAMYDENDVCFRFRDAYDAAMEMVEYRKGNIMIAVDYMKKIAGVLLDALEQIDVEELARMLDKVNPQDKPEQKKRAPKKKKGPVEIIPLENGMK